MSDLAVDRSGQGAPFVWAHGLTSSRANEDRRALFDWSPVSAEGYEVIRYDAGGHGESEGPADPAAYWWRQLATDLLGLLDALAIDRCAAGGASMGCATVLHAAVRSPERFERLVLVIPPTAWETRVVQVELYEASAGFVETKGKAVWVDLAASAPRPSILEDDPNPFEADIPEKLLPAVLRGAATSDLPEPDAIAGLAIPALVLAWDTDPGHPVSTALRLRELLSHGDLHVAATLADVRAWPALVADFLVSDG